MAQLAHDIQWIESFVAGNKTFCVYLATDEALTHKHAEISGFLATEVMKFHKMIDPTTAKPDVTYDRILITRLTSDHLQADSNGIAADKTVIATSIRTS